MLLMIRAKPAIIWAPIFDGRIELQRHLPGPQRLPREFVILGVGADEDFLKPMLWAPLVQVDIAVLNDDLGLDLAETGGTQAAGEFVENARSIGHLREMSL